MVQEEQARFELQQGVPLATLTQLLEAVGDVCWLDDFFALSDGGGIASGLEGVGFLAAQAPCSTAGPRLFGGMGDA